MKTTPNNDFFIKVSNDDIYNEIVGLKIQVEHLKHKVTLAAWTGATALTISLINIVIKSVL